MRRRSLLHRLRRVALTAAGLAMVAPAAVAGYADPLESRIDASVLQRAFPGADTLGPVAGTPPAAPAMAGGDIVGYLFSTHDTVGSTGYAGDTFDIVVGMGLDAAIAGTVLLEHREPIIGPGAIRTDAVQNYLDTLDGLPAARQSREKRRASLDGISGATVSSKLMFSAVFSAARRIGRETGVVAAASDSALSLDLDFHEDERWRGLVADGGVGRLRLTRADVERAFPAGAVRFGGGDGDRVFADVYAALVTPAGLGQNLFGKRWHTVNMSQIEVGDSIVLVGSRGPYDALGSRFSLSSTFDRVEILQGERRFGLSYNVKLKHAGVQMLGAPRLRSQALFRLEAGGGFDPAMPWTLRLFVEPDAAGGDRALEPAVFDMPYRLPAKYVVGEDFALEEAGYKAPEYALAGLVRVSTLGEWQRIWLARSVDIALLAVLLAALTAVLVLQHRVARRRRWHTAVRIGFLAVVLGWLGFAKDAQLTTVNLIAWAQAAFRDVDPVLLLLDPLIFLLSAYVAVTLVLWGRGVFCGWLCPFGAMQELLNRAARAVGVRQIVVPETVQERLWAVKYVVLIGIVALAALVSTESANAAAEIEPFKTAIVVIFDRSWPYVAWALALLAVGLVIERFFCRFLCPLGAAFAILGRARLLNWLKRRPQCGNPCQVCKSSCPVGAIRNDGAIDMNECFQCLDCQVDYEDHAVCPPLVARRKRLERLTPTQAAAAAAG